MFHFIQRRIKMLGSDSDHDFVDEFHQSSSDSDEDMEPGAGPNVQSVADPDLPPVGDPALPPVDDPALPPVDDPALPPVADPVPPKDIKCLADLLDKYYEESGDGHICKVKRHPDQPGTCDRFIAGASNNKNGASGGSRSNNRRRHLITMHKFLKKVIIIDYLVDIQCIFLF